MMDLDRYRYYKGLTLAELEAEVIEAQRLEAEAVREVSNWTRAQVRAGKCLALLAAIRDMKACAIEPSGVEPCEDCDGAGEFEDGTLCSGCGSTGEEPEHRVYAAS